MSIQIDLTLHCTDERQKDILYPELTEKGETYLPISFTPTKEAVQNLSRLNLFNWASFFFPLTKPLKILNTLDNSPPPSFIYIKKNIKKDSIRKLIDKSMQLEPQFIGQKSKGQSIVSLLHNSTKKFFIKSSRVGHSHIFQNCKIKGIQEDNFVIKKIRKFQQNQWRQKTGNFIDMWGLICEEDIQPGECVIEYVGEVIQSIESDTRGKVYDDKKIASFYLFDMNQTIDKIWEDKGEKWYQIDDLQIRGADITKEFPLCVDAFFYGNHARFVNHSCDPNLIAVNYHKTEHLLYSRIYFFANRLIKAGEELTIDYNISPVSNENQQEIECVCGSDKCRGLLYDLDKNNASKKIVIEIE